MFGEHTEQVSEGSKGSCWDGRGDVGTTDMEKKKLPRHHEKAFMSTFIHLLPRARLGFDGK